MSAHLPFLLLIPSLLTPTCPPQPDSVLSCSCPHSIPTLHLPQTLSLSPNLVSTMLLSFLHRNLTAPSVQFLTWDSLDQDSPPPQATPTGQQKQLYFLCSLQGQPGKEPNLRCKLGQRCQRGTYFHPTSRSNILGDQAPHNTRV